MQTTWVLPCCLHQKTANFVTRLQRFILCATATCVHRICLQFSAIVTCFIMKAQNKGKFFCMLEIAASCCFCMPEACDCKQFEQREEIFICPSNGKSFYGPKQDNTRSSMTSSQKISSDSV